MNKLIGIIICCIITTLTTQVNANDWQLIWSDEFNGKKGTPLDLSKWTYEVKENNYNNELQYYTDHPVNASLDGQGHLLIRAIKEDLGSKHYTSARLNTYSKFEPMFGRIEARIKLPFSQGMLPAFWMIGANKKEVGYPACGEIDIVEYVGKDPYVVSSNLHATGYVGTTIFKGRHSLPNHAKFSDDFHIFAMEWEPNVIRFYIDNVLQDTHTPDKLASDKIWAYNHSFYIILNLAVGGNWPGNPDSTTVFPQSLVVDYVRVYQR